MGFVRFCACCLGVGACLVTVGCGGSSSGTTSGTDGAGRLDRRRAPQMAGGRSMNRCSRAGSKGKTRRPKRRRRARISAADCAALGRLAERRLGDHAVAAAPTPKPPLSRCRLSGHGTEVNVYLDAGFAAHQRYPNRIAETVQFNTENPAGLPQPVPHVGEKAAYNADANWIPALRSLLAVRGNRWLTVTISVAGRSNEELRDEAAVLARAGFRLSAS